MHESESMLHLPDPEINGVSLTHCELRAIHVEARRALSEATALTTLDGSPLPVTWRTGGWRYRIRVFGRDTGKQLLLAILVRGPNLTGTYVRRVRLVTARTLPC